MTKQEFVDQVASRLEGKGVKVSRKEAAEAVDAVLGTIEDTLKRGSDVSFTGFGKFHVADRGERQGVNPQTKQRITIPASRVPRFTAGSGLKNAIKGS